MLRSRHAMVLLACCLVACRPAAALYEKGGAVQVLSPRTFSLVKDSKLPVVVEFFAPWCGHCKSLAPKYAKAAETLQGIVPFVAVDCDQQSSKPLCGQYGIQGFPTIKIFVDGKPRDYHGQRTAAALVDAATGLLSAKRITKVSSPAGATALAADGLPGVLLLTDKPKATPLYKSLSTRFEGQLKFGQAPSSAADVARLYGVDSFPALVVLRLDGTHARYEGKLTPTKVIEFLRGVAGKAEAPKGGDSAGSKNAGKQERRSESTEEPRASDSSKDAKADQPPALRNVTLPELKGLLEEDGVALLAIHSGTAAACSERLAEVDGAVRGLHDLVPALQLDASSDADAKALAEAYGVTAEAADTGCMLRVYLLPFEDKDDPDEWKLYEGPVSTKELYRAAMDLFPDPPVDPITNNTVDGWIGTQITNAKVVLFYDKDEPPPLLRALATNFRQWKIDFGLAPASDAALKKRLGVQQVPSLVVVYARPGKADTKGKGVEIGIQPYGGALRYGPASEFLRFIGLRLGVAPDGLLEDLILKEAGDQAIVEELADRQGFEASCLKKGGVCLIGLLNAGSQQHTAHLAVLKSVAALRAGEPFHLSWVDASRFPGFVRGLGASPINVPGLAILSPKKQRAATLATPFGREAVNKFIDDVLGGRITTVPLQRLPTFESAQEEPEQSEEPVEEEFDLADIMGEEVEHAGAFGKAKDEL